MSIIYAEKLNKNFGRTQVLRGLDLSIDAPAIYGLLGRNGAGKTTLIKSLMGLVIPDAGCAAVLGADLGSGCPPQKAQVAYVAQGEILPAWARVADLLRFDAALRPEWQQQELDAWLAREQIDSRQRVGKLSGGQRKRLEVELALAGRPRVLLLDEPFAGLDPVARAEVMERIIGLAAEQPMAILLSSHILGDLERICDRIGVLAGGRVVFEAELDELKAGAAVVSARGSEVDPALPCAARVVASHGNGAGRIWVLQGLAEADAGCLRDEGYSVVQGDLEALGVELLRQLEVRS